MKRTRYQVDSEIDYSRDPDGETIWVLWATEDHGQFGIRQRKVGFYETQGDAEDARAELLSEAQQLACEG